MLIDTIEKLESIIPSLLACMNPCVDTETTGLNIFGTSAKERSKIIGISIDDGREAYYFPFRHMQGQNLPEECWGFFREYLADPHRTYGGWNYKFDQHMMYQDGIPYSLNFEDAMLALHLLNENEPNFRLKDFADRYGIGAGSLEESILEDKVFDECQRLDIECSRAKGAERNTKSMMYVLPAADVEPYACDDVRLTRGALDMLIPALKYHGLYDIWKQVNYYSYITARMEQRGMLIDPDTIRRYQEESILKKEDAFKRLYKKAGYELNPNSSKQVCAFLGVESSAAERLVELVDAGGEGAERAKLITEARGWSSVNSRYYTPYLECMDKNNAIHCNLNLIGTISGRLSCTNPNLQAVARHTDVFKVKDVFVSRPGFTLVQADYKQAEMRLVTYYTKDNVMRKLIEAGADLHSATAETLGIPRNAAKRINFGVVYGIGAEHLASTLRIDQATAKGYLDKYHGLYPGFRKLIKLCEQKAESEGEIVVWTGRKRHYNMVGMDAHKAMSNLIQGGVAEIARIAMSRLYPAIENMGGYMVLQVHDSIMFEIPDERLDVALPTIKMIMEDFDFVPAVGVDIEYGKSWGALRGWEPGGTPTGGHGRYFSCVRSADSHEHPPEERSQEKRQEEPREST